METKIGVVTHYFSHLGVAAIALTGDLRVSEIVHIQGHTTDFYQEIWSMEINHHQIDVGKKGEEVAIKCNATVRSGDHIFLAPEAIPTKPDELQQIDSWER